MQYTMGIFTSEHKASIVARNNAALVDLLCFVITSKTSGVGDFLFNDLAVKKVLVINNTGINPACTHKTD